MKTHRRAVRLSAVAAALCLALAACGGDDGTADSADTADTAGLPTAEDLGGDTEQPPGDDEPVTAAVCAPEEPDCEDMIAPDSTGDAATGGAAGSCLTGDPNCTDESFDGRDVARPVPLAGSPSGAERIAAGATTGATGRPLVAAHLLDETTLELTVEGGACDLLEDAMVTESPGEVRVLVLTGPDPSVDACTQQVVEWSTEVQLDAPLADRALLDLAG